MNMFLLDFKSKAKLCKTVHVPHFVVSTVIPMINDYFTYLLVHVAPLHSLLPLSSESCGWLPYHTFFVHADTFTHIQILTIPWTF